MGEDLLTVFKESFKDRMLPLSCRRTVITLLPEKGNLQEMKNWRPVSLLCSDYKILFKALANWLREVMTQVIHKDQTYCVSGRSILDSVSLIRDILDISGSLGIRTGLTSLDQEKAFDRVEHLFLWKTLERFGLSPGLTAMIKVMYQDIESVLKINGSLGAPFRVRRGVRQGCSLSGMLYELAIEPLLCKIRANIGGQVLKGFNKGFILPAYADDIVIFGTLSGAKVNWAKSEALAVGNWREGLPSLPRGGADLEKDGFKYLGVYVGE
uniref:Reverse transcriptase domain-containing protein n=1 Tax=Gasterosteus aculeatus aculeatus TaxID=481459 RepID=A0AAQ4R1S1_GASAC